jgi:hypothetical protein
MTDAVVPVQPAEIVEHPRSIYDMPIPSEAAVSHYQQMVYAARRLLVMGVDIETIPGIKKPVFTQSAGRKLTAAWKLRSKYTVLPDYVQNSETGEYHYKVRTELLAGDNVVGEGLGSCSSKEKKYAYRWVTARDIKNDPELSHYRTDELPKRYNKYKKCDEYRIANPEIHDIANTVLKMAKKRSFVDACLTTFGLENEFTQDLEDSPGARRQVQNTAPPPADEPPPPEDVRGEEPQSAVTVWENYKKYAKQIAVEGKDIQEGFDQLRVRVFESFGVNDLKDIPAGSIQEFRKWLSANGSEYLGGLGYIKRAGQ